MPYSHPHNQNGVALIAMLSLLVLIFSALSLNHFNQSNIQQLKRQKTQQALSEAKQALLAYSSEPLANTSCNVNCARPGDLPCPDLDNDGEAENNCSTQSSRLGRLPWKTLGLNDLKDSDGESLWYAVSNQFKNNPRVLPLNSETAGVINLTNTQGNIIYDASNAAGLAAIVIAPQSAIKRTDDLQQIRSSNNINSPSHYLDVAFNEDNADFIDNTQNGFVSGPIKINDQTIVNDVILPITATQMHRTMEKRVLTEVLSALLDYHCANNVDLHNRQCTVTSTNALPFPAVTTDVSCLGFTNLATSDCLSTGSYQIGRIPVNETITTISGNVDQPIWLANNSNSILRGNTTHNWFQQNGWRELIFYARLPECTTGPCTNLTLMHAITPFSNPTNLNKSIILLSSGKALSFQTRIANNKTQLSDYLEDDNLNNPNSLFVRLPFSSTHNDQVISMP